MTFAIHLGSIKYHLKILRSHWLVSFRPFLSHMCIHLHIEVPANGQNLFAPFSPFRALFAFQAFFLVMNSWQYWEGGAERTISREEEARSELSRTRMLAASFRVREHAPCTTGGASSLPPSSSSSSSSSSASVPLPSTLYSSGVLHRDDNYL